MRSNADLRRKRVATALRILLLLVLLTAFLVAIKLMGSSIKMLGKETAERLFEGVSNPIAGLSVGILATVLVQSSSVTTATIVGLVGSGQLSVVHAVPMVMGANIGTSITNTLVSLGHITRGAEFRRAFAGATMHDFFNLIAVVVLLPAELATGFLHRAAADVTSFLHFGGVQYHSPLKAFIGIFSGAIKGFVTDVLGLSHGPGAIVLLVIALGLIVVSLIYITKNMRTLIAGRMEQALNRVLGRSGLLGMAVGILLTVAVQSSSITTSLLVPLIGAGVLTLEAAFPITLGANVGTTVTAMLAALATDKAGGLTIALVHLLFNVAGILMMYPIKGVPLWLARKLADVAQRNKLWVLVYILGVFVVLPLLGIILFE